MPVKTERACVADARGRKPARKMRRGTPHERLIKNRGLASAPDVVERTDELRIAKFIQRCKNRNEFSRFLDRRK